MYKWKSQAEGGVLIVCNALLPCSSCAVLCCSKRMKTKCAELITPITGAKGEELGTIHHGDGFTLLYGSTLLSGPG